jgi:hypothetical protein
MKITDAWREAVFSPEVSRDWLDWRKSHKLENPDPVVDIVDEEPVLTLKSLHDRHGRQKKVHKLFPILVRQIEEAWTARSQRSTREEILKRFELLRQLEPTEFDDILKNSSGWDAGTWAVQIIRDRSGLAPSTIRKYGQPGVHRGQRQSGSLSTAA